MPSPDRPRLVHLIRKGLCPTRPATLLGKLSQPIEHVLSIAVGNPLPRHAGPYCSIAAAGVHGGLWSDAAAGVHGGLWEMLQRECMVASGPMLQRGCMVASGRWSKSEAITLPGTCWPVGCVPR